ncbi:unnamed protein product [Boreogadus saida]
MALEATTAHAADYCVDRGGFQINPSVDHSYTYQVTEITSPKRNSSRQSGRQDSSINSDQRSGGMFVLIGDGSSVTYFITEWRLSARLVGRTPRGGPGHMVSGHRGVQYRVVFRLIRLSSPASHHPPSILYAPRDPLPPPTEDPPNVPHYTTLQPPTAPYTTLPYTTLGQQRCIAFIHSEDACGCVTGVKWRMERASVLDRPT